MVTRLCLFWEGRVALVAVLLLIASATYSQPRYRTFSQESLAMKKAKAGKVTGSTVTFKFVNERLTPVEAFHAIVGKKILAVIDSGGFPDWKITNERVIDATGRSVAGGDSITITLLVKNKQAGTVVNYFWWLDGEGDRRSRTEMKIPAIADQQHYTQPNGGNVRHYLHKNVIPKENGVILGIPNTSGRGYARYTSSSVKSFPATGEPRCFDNIVTAAGGGLKAITKEMKNLRVKKHNNHLVGELHALKLAIIANDAGITEPDPAENTRLGDLLYDAPEDASDPFNGMTIRELAAHTDSALTFCGKHPAEYYKTLDAVITRINAEFGGEYVAVSFEPFLLAGGGKLVEAEYLHPNPNPPPMVTQPDAPSILEETPSAFGLTQNYPNPFNPVTTIGFLLPEASVVNLRIYDMLGREVAAPIVEEEYDEGQAAVDFEADELPSGVYHYKLTAIGIDDPAVHHQMTKSMVLVR